MLKLCTVLTLTATACLGAAAAMLTPKVALAQKAALAPAQAKALTKTRKSYEKCRKDTLAALKTGAITKKKFEVQLNACKEQYPGAALYIKCKKDAIKTANSKNIAPDAAVDQCKNQLVAASFAPDEPLPFYVNGGQLYFAGVGLNRELPAAQLSAPNFDCDKVQKLVKSPNDAQYILFGNHPNVFTALSTKKGPALLAALKYGKADKKAQTKGVDVPGFGRVFGDPTKPSGLVLFPTAACDFDSEPGDIFSGMSAYYLLDPLNSIVVPYFGIAYYRADQTSVTSAKLAQSFVKLLGNDFKVSSKKTGVSFITHSTSFETDDEKDPKNLCAKPRRHRFVGVIQNRTGSQTPEYAVLANISNLCNYGEKITERLFK